MRNTIAVVFLALTVFSASAGQYFLNLAGINGEVTIPAFKNQIEIHSIQFGLAYTEAIGGGGGGAGKVNFSEITLTKPLDRASPLLMLNCAKGAHFPTATFTAVETVSGTNRIYYEIALKEVLITSVSLNGSGGERPTESIALSFATIEWKYRMTDGTQVTAGWDLKLNKEL